MVHNEKKQYSCYRNNKGKEKATESIFKVVMVKNFTKLGREMASISKTFKGCQKG